MAVDPESDSITDGFSVAVVRRRGAWSLVGPPPDSTAGASGQVAPITERDYFLPDLAENLDSSEVRRWFGAPDSVLIKPHPFDASAKRASWFYRHFSVLFTSAGRIDGKWLRDSTLATRRGLRVGDSADRVRALYGEPTGIYQGTWEYQSKDENLHAVRLEIRDGRVAAIYLGWLLD